MKIPFNFPYMSGREIEYIKQAHAAGHLSGDGNFTRRCHEWLETNIGCKKALLTTSCTTALEMAAILANIKPGDEVIMPSFTFVSTANAFVLRGGIPVFVDIRPDTLNIDYTKIESSITERTKAIVPIHYAGVGCDMDAILELSQKYNLIVIEDAAQGIMASYKERPLGGMGHMGALSFHESKNIICGEGGALLLNDPAFVKRAEIIWEKGTNRRDFYRGKVDKYVWVDVGSSYLPSEIHAAFLLSQLEEAESITNRRMKIWETYNNALSSIARKMGARPPAILESCVHNAHFYYLIMPDHESRQRLIANLKEKGVEATFHYIPLHDSPGGKKYGKTYDDLPVTIEMSNRIVRFPLWLGIEDKLDYLIENVLDALEDIK